MPSKSKAQLRAEQPFEIPAELQRLMVPVERIRPLEGNPRRGDVELIKESLRENGLYRAPVARKETSEILVNNHTVRAALELGATALPIDWRSVPDDDRARAIALVDNRASDRAKYDQDALMAMLETQAASKAGLAGTGFTRDQFDGLLDRHSKLRLRDPEPIERPKRARTKRGQVVELGDHRLICGDATDPKAIDKLLAGDEVDCVWTDPPYGVDLASVAEDLSAMSQGVRARIVRHGDMVGDTLEPAALEELWTKALGLAQGHARPGAAIYLCHAETNRAIAERAMTAGGWQHKQTIIWIKNAMVLGRQDYQWRHEPVLYGWCSGPHRWFGDYSRTTVVESATRGALEELEYEDLVEIAWRLLEEAPGTIVRVDRPRSADLHPTVKPVDLIAPMVRNSAPEGGIVLDPFAGSGSTMLAAEQTRRRARLVEIDPGYCDVIRQRWEDAGAGD